MNCYICDADDWHKVMVERDGKPAPIHTQSAIQLCKNCGNAAHAVEPDSEAKVLEFYRKDYRPAPTIMNIITTTHKLNYIRVFLKDFLTQNKGRQMNVGDVGAATGYLLHFFKQLGHKVSGAELTVTYRRMSEHYYGIPLAERLEPKHKYDVITIYHVLEHLVEPDKKLAQYASLLADGGHMLVATPEWFATLEEASGTPTQSFDALFHKNHINLFSANSIQNLFRKAGLAIVKEDHVQYGQTYLLKKSGEPSAEGQDPPAPAVERWLTKEDWREVLRVMLTQYRALEAQAQGRFRDARQVYPNFPEAWLGEIFHRCTKDLAKQGDLFAEAEKFVGRNMRYVLAKAQWFYQQGRLAEATAGFQEVLRVKPNEDTFMVLGYALAQAGRGLEARQCFEQAAAMDPRKWTEATQWILSAASQTPAWDEVAMAEAGKALAPVPAA